MSEVLLHHVECPNCPCASPLPLMQVNGDGTHVFGCCMCGTEIALNEADIPLRPPVKNNLERLQHEYSMADTLQALRDECGLLGRDLCTETIIRIGKRLEEIGASV